MKKVIISSVQLVSLEIEGVNSLQRIVDINNQIVKLHKHLKLLWTQYNTNPSEKIMSLIDMYTECLNDYEGELDYLLDE